VDRVVVTRWVHPEVAGYLAGFCDPVLPGAGVWPRERVAEGDRHVRGGAFAGWRPDFYGSGLHGATAGIVGMGRLGQAVAERLAPFGTRITYHDPRPLPDAAQRRLNAARLELGELLAGSDVVLLCLPLTFGTLRLVDASRLQTVRPGAFLVNLGRGSVVDEEAVADVLQAGRLGGYAADVFAMEDWAEPGRPAAIPARLLAHPRTPLTPHLGSAVDQARRRMSLEAARQVRQVLEGGRPDRAVNEPLRRPV
jgi:phosphonate dehydrogenase